MNDQVHDLSGFISIRGNGEPVDLIAVTPVEPRAQIFQQSPQRGGFNISPTVLRRLDHECLIVTVIAAIEPQMQGVLGRLKQHRLLEISPQAARQRVTLPLELALLLCRQFGANQSVEGELAAI